MKNKKCLIFLVLIMYLFINTGVVNAAIIRKGIVTATAGLKLRSTAGTSGTHILTMPYNSSLIITEDAASGNGCVDKWVKVQYEASGKSYTGYACSTYIKVTDSYDDSTNTITFGNHTAAIPKTYTTTVKNNTIAFTSNNNTYFLQVNSSTYDNLKTNKNSLVGTLKIRDDLTITTTEVTVKLFDNKEYIVAKGTDSYYFATKKDGITNAVVFGVKGTTTENDVYRLFTSIVNSIKEEYTANNMSNMTDAEFDAYLTNQGFPDTYKTKLKEIHKKHPTWVFIGTKTKYTWANAMKAQDEFSENSKDTSPGNSFLNVNPTRVAEGLEGYLSTQPNDYSYYTNKFVPHDGLYWYQANSAAIAHYMDPRNYLSESALFMFEDLTYDSSYQTEATVKTVLSSDFLKQYSAYFMEAAIKYNVSPIFLASLVKQEVGTGSNNICTNGKAGKLSDGIDYTGYYNFFNIGAASSSNPKLASLRQAKAYGWTTPRAAIVDGAGIISRNYIACGQYTLYYQKYNFAPTATKEMWHQYTTNINSLESQSVSTFNSYKALNVAEKAFKFDIPIFTSMPASTPLPKKGNPNNYLKTLKVNGLAVSNFDGAKNNQSITIPYADKVSITGTLVASTSTVTGLDTFTMTGNTVTKNVVVTSANGVPKTYVLTITMQPNPNTNTGGSGDTTTPDNPTDGTNTNTNTNTNTYTVANVISSSTYKTDNTYLWNITYGTSVSTIVNKLKTYNSAASITVNDKNNKVKTSGTIGTGDKVIINTGSETKTLSIVIYGDTSGDGKISGIDLLNMQKHILGVVKLSGPYLKSADTSKDGKISGIDLLNMQKHILGKLVISQS